MFFQATLFVHLFLALVAGIEFESDAALRAWCESYHLHPAADDLVDAFLFYARPNGLFEQQTRDKDVDLVFFFASLLHQPTYFEARRQLYRRASHKQASDSLRKALLLSLWHVASNQNHFLLRRATRFWWPRPRRELMQVETALDRRLAEQKKRRSDPVPTPPLSDGADADGDDEAAVIDDHDSKAEPPIVGVLKPADDVAGLHRLWAVFRATGDRRALHQIARLAFSTAQNVDATARAEARASLDRAFRNAALAPIFDKLYFDLSHESEPDRAALEFFAKIRAEAKTEL